MTRSSLEKNRDTVFISGDYQKRAITSGNPLQRAWHKARLGALRHALELSPNDVLADIGCGSGISIEQIAPHVRRVYGVDSNESVVQFGRRHFENQKNVQIVHGTLSNTSIEPSSLTKIVCTEVLEHVYDNQVPEILAHWKSLLTPQGQIFLTVPNNLSIWPVLEWCVDRLALVPKLAGDQHVSKWDAFKMKRTLLGAGFTNVRTGSFNLVSPAAYVTGSDKVGEMATKLEVSYLKFAGPLLWATASAH